MRQTGNIWRLCIVVACLSLVAVVGSTSTQSAEAQTSRVVLNVGWPWDPENLDPGADWTQAGFTVRRLTYEGLVYLDAGGQLVPGLATSWQVSNDQRVYTFRLRRGVKFHDGSMFNAEAAKFGIERANSVRGGPFFPNLGDWIQSVDAVDDLTLRITLKAPFAPFLNKMAAIWARIFVCPQTAKANAAGGDQGAVWLKDNMCGTGPYQFVAWVREGRIVLRRFRDYWEGWGQGGAIEVVNFVIVREPFTRRLMIERGDLDVGHLIPLQDLKDLSRRPGVKVMAFMDRPLVQYYMWMMSGRPPLNDKRVRQAISYAINYEKIVENILGGYAKTAVGPLPAGLWGHDPSTPRYRRDLDKARTLLREAGLSQPTGITVKLMWFTGFEEQKLIAQQIQSDLAEIGITVQPFEATSAVARQISRDINTAPELRFYFTASDVDPDDYVYRFHSTQTEPVGRNSGWYKNLTVDQLLDKGRAVADRRERARVYSALQKALVEDPPAAYLFTLPTIFVMRANIVGYEYVPFDGIAMNVEKMRKNP